MAGDAWDLDGRCHGPVFWGHDQLGGFLLEFLADFASPPGQPGRQEQEEEREAVDPEDERFTAFVFKIQANMNPGTATAWPSCAW